MSIPTVHAQEKIEARRGEVSTQEGWSEGEKRVRC